MYGKYRGAHQGQAPKNEAAFKAYIAGLSETDLTSAGVSKAEINDIFVSPRDNKPYVVRYNEAAVAVMKEAGVPVHDLHWVVHANQADKLLGKDGTHYTPEGYERLAEAVADCILRQLTIARYKPLPVPAPLKAQKRRVAGAKWQRREQHHVQVARGLAVTLDPGHKLDDGLQVARHPGP